MAEFNEGGLIAKEISLIFTCRVPVLGKITHLKFWIKDYFSYIKKIMC